MLGSNRTAAAQPQAASASQSSVNLILNEILPMLRRHEAMLKTLVNSRTTAAAGYNTEKLRKKVTKRLTPTLKWVETIGDDTVISLAGGMEGMALYSMCIIKFA